MFRLKRCQHLPIGLDIGRDSVKLLQLAQEDSELRVHAAARESLSPEVAALGATEVHARTAAAALLVKDMLKRHPFRGNRVIPALPREMVFAKNIRLPQMPPAEIESAVRFEARSIFPFDVDQAVVHYIPAGEVRQGAEQRLEVMVVAAASADVELFVEQLHRAGLEVASVDIEPTALFRSVERFVRRREDEQEVYVVVDVGSRQTQVVIGKGRELSFIKTIDIGGARLHEAVSHKLGISLGEAMVLRRRLMEQPDDADETRRRDPVRQAVADATRTAMEDLAREISLCLRYYSVTFRGQRPTRVRLAGGECWDPQLRTLLNGALTIPVEANCPLFNVDTTRMSESDRRGSMGEWTVALGLSLKLTSGPFKPRDGRKRAVQVSGQRAAEVVDLDKALSAVGESLDPGGAPRLQGREVASNA